MKWLGPTKSRGGGTITYQKRYSSGRIVQASHGRPSLMDWVGKGDSSNGEKFDHGSTTKKT